MSQPLPGAEEHHSEEATVQAATVPRVNGVFIFPSNNNVIDAGDLMARDRRQTGIIAETITGGVPDASDQLPEGTIIVSP